MNAAKTNGNGRGVGGGNSGALIPQPHGGALLPGGVHGHKGGRGKPRSKVRQAAALAFEERLPILSEIADGRGYVDLTERCPKCGHEGEKLTANAIKAAIPSPSDRTRALDVLGKYGGVDKLELTDEEQPRESGQAMMARVLEAVPNMLAMVPGAREQVEQALRDADHVVEADFTVEGVDVEP